MNPQELQQAIDSAVAVIRGEINYNDTYKKLREVALAHVTELYKVQVIKAAAITSLQVQPFARPGSFVEVKK